jgi:hypothetical protein
MLRYYEGSNDIAEEERVLPVITKIYSIYHCSIIFVMSLVSLLREIVVPKCSARAIRALVAGSANSAGRWICKQSFYCQSSPFS